MCSPAAAADDAHNDCNHDDEYGHDVYIDNEQHLNSHKHNDHHDIEQHDNNSI